MWEEADVGAQCYLNEELPEHWACIRWQEPASREGLNQGCQVLGLHITGH